MAMPIAVTITQNLNLIERKNLLREPNFQFDPSDNQMTVSSGHGHQNSLESVKLGCSYHHAMFERSHSQSV